MCGRSSLTKTEKEIEARFHATFYSEDLERYNPLPNYNVAPTQYHPVITNLEPGIIHLFKWGLIPFWAKDIKIGPSMINARAETILEKPAFKNAFKSRRCIVPLDGFYEWKIINGEKIPFRILTTDQEIFTVAGLWEVWKSPTGENIFSFTIITVEANQFMKKIHDRMPAILTKETEKLWIDNNIPSQQLGELLTQYPNQNLRAYQVNKLVNNVRNNFPELLEPVSDI